MAKRLIHSSLKASLLEDFDLDSINDDEVLLRTLTSGISLGTEKKVAEGQVPANISEMMHVPYMTGDFGFPLGYGYSLVGQVIEGGNEWLGLRVHLMHPHQDVCIVKKSDLMKVPGDISDAKATLISNMETALNGYWDGEIKPKDRILIIGFGQIGALLSGILKIKVSNPIQIFEKDQKRREIAESMGLETVDEISQASYDIVYNTAGNAQAIEASFKALKFEGRLIELSWYGDKKVSINLGSDFHIKRLKMISSQVSHLPKRMMRNWNFEKRKKAVIELLQNPWYDQFPIQAIPFNESPQFFDQLRNNKTPELAYYLKYS